VTTPSGGTPGSLRASRSSGLDARGALTNVVYIAVAVLAVLAVWQGVVVIWDVPQYLLPPPATVAEALWEDRGELWEQTLVTGLESVLAFVLAVVVGAALGVVIAFSKPLARVLFPILVGSNAIPKVALAPLFIVWLGFGLESKVIIGLTIAVFPVVINTVAGLQAVPNDMVELARSMGGGALRTFAKIRVPYALPSFFAGLKIAISLAVVGAVVGEFVGADSGLGYVMIVTGSQLNAPLLYAALVALTIMAIVLYLGVELLQILLDPGSRSRGRSRR
jgi:NitT/TauT family transport system permease protein